TALDGRTGLPQPRAQDRRATGGLDAQLGRERGELAAGHRVEQAAQIGLPPAAHRIGGLGGVEDARGRRSRGEPAAPDPREPPGGAPAGRPALAAVIVTDDVADRAAIETTATTLAHTLAPEVTAPGIAIARGPARTELATVGPFTVAARSRGPLRALLVAG